MSKNIDIIILSETWINKGMFLNICGFDAIRKNRLSRKGGGVAVYLRNNIRYTTLDHIQNCNGCIEICAVKLYWVGN